MIFQIFWETQKDTWYQKTFEKCGDIKKIKIHMWTVWLLSCSLCVHRPWTLKKKITGTSTKWNAKFNCTGLGFISKNEEYNPPKNISNGKYLKNLMLQKVVNSRE